jgi:plasmid stabilization system protein ParE
MTYQVIWTNKARETYNQNLDYLLQNWEDKVYYDFVNRVEVVVDHLRQNPKMFVAIDVNRNIYRCVVTKHVSLFYQLTGNSVLLLLFWNNFQEPEKLPL